MANLGLSLSIPLSASEDAARAPQLDWKKVQVPEMKPEKIGRNDTQIWDFQMDFGAFDRSGFWQRGSHDFFLQTHAVAILFIAELPCIAVPSVNIEVIGSIDKNKRYEEDPPGPSPKVL